MIDFKKYFIVGTNSDALHDTMNGIVTGELIRCKDCRWFRNDDEETWCVTWAGEKTNPDAFCAYAKPKENK